MHVVEKQMNLLQSEVENALNDQHEVPLAGFPVGTAVRVKPGTIDPDFPDIPLVGWAGTIQETDPPAYLVKWNQATLDQMAPIYRERCERDDLEVETMWLGEDDLQLNTGEPTASIERPTVLVPRSLSPKDQDDRIPAIFGPWVTKETIHRLHRYQSFPFQTVALILALWGMTCGIVLGSLLAAIEIAHTFVVFGGVILGFFGCLAGSKVGTVFGRLYQKRSWPFWGGILGAIGGLIVGAMFGAMAVAALGIMIGGFIGAMVSEWLFRRRKRISAIFLGSMVGATVQAFIWNQEQALIGAIWGAAIGASVGILGVFGLRILITRNRSK